LPSRLVEFALGLSNNLLERSILEYYLGDLIQNSEFEKVAFNFKGKGRAMNLNWTVKFQFKNLIFFTFCVL
jgi:hypothetical protein